MAGVVAAVGFFHDFSAGGSHQRHSDGGPHGHSGHSANAPVPMAAVPSGNFNAVTVGPGRSTWAVGTAPGGPLIEHWNGATWSQSSAPGISANPGLAAVATAHDGTAWAVGSDCPAGCGTAESGSRTLVLQWDGTAWSRSPSPSPGGGAILDGVAIEQNGTAWAVGCSPCANSPAKALILHGDGSSWSRISSPVVAPLSSVAVGPGSVAWAVGSQILRWNGAAWTRVPSPGVWALNSISVGSDGTAWAVGYDCQSCGTKRGTQAHGDPSLEWV